MYTTDKKYERPNEVEHLLGDASKIKKKLLWEPKVGFDELVTLMVDSDLKSAEREKTSNRKRLIRTKLGTPHQKLNSLNIPIIGLLGDPLLNLFLPSIQDFGALELSINLRGFPSGFVWSNSNFTFKLNNIFYQNN